MKITFDFFFRVFEFDEAGFVIEITSHDTTLIPNIISLFG